MMSEIYTAAASPFRTAELDYRRERVTALWAPRRRLRARRRPGLELPGPSPRPRSLAVA